MRNIRLKVAYDGTHYLGWQKTAMGPSIEESLQKTLKQILQQEVSLQAASRTDAGVHAKGQIVNFFLEKEAFSPDKLLQSLNCLLPKDIIITDIAEVPLSFHPTTDCISKEYRYSVCFDRMQMPHRRLYSWHFPYPLDLKAMRRTARHLVGEHDFSAFCNFKKNNNSMHHVREVQEINIVECGEMRLLFIIRGNNFLYKMVRNLVGTLLYAGCGKIAEVTVPAVLLGKDRKQAGVTAPAHGLSLHSVKYGKD